MNIAIIPARGGSKRIPKKNIKIFFGKPMIAWAIEVAQKSKLFEHIIVSTDDKEIAEISRKWGAETPFVRPKNLADDETPTVPVISHAVNYCLQNGYVLNYACCIYPCVPFLQVKDLVEALDLCKKNDAEFVYTVTEYPHPVQRAMRLSSNGKMEFCSSKDELTRTQDLEKLYHDVGQFYWGKASAWQQQKKMHSEGFGLPIPNWRAVDIDTKEDWERAEIMFETISQARKNH